jgi:sugar (pentulose or hexulose) kinase
VEAVDLDRDLVIGIDVSTTATKAIAWDALGRAVASERAALAMQRPGPHLYEQDPHDWWRAVCRTLSALTATVAPERIAGLAIAHQRETVAPVTADGEPVRPAILWLDQRCRPQVDRVVAALGLERIRAISGKSADFGPVLYKLAWMREVEPELHRRSAVFCDVQGFLVQRLTGAFRTSWASADPLALFDLAEHAWSPELCAAAGIGPERLPEAYRPGARLGEVTPAAAQATGLKAGTPVFAGGGDGQAAGLGVNALSAARAYLNLGTALVFGIYSAQCLHDPAWRTMTSCSGTGYYLESSLRTGALLSDWFLQRICGLAPGDEKALQAIEREAAALPPGSGGTLLLPYWEGAMNPYWDMDMRGCILGLSDAHERGHVYRGLIEGVALEQALVLDLIAAQTKARPDEFIAIGGVAASDLWCQVVADVLGIPVSRSETVEAASLGAAVCAAGGAGLHPSIEAAAERMCGRTTAVYAPDDARHARYRELLAIYRDLYPQVRDLARRLSAFAASAVAHPS